MPDTRTGPLVQKLVDGLREDMAEAIEHLTRGLATLRALEGETKGVNGLASLLRSKGNELETVIGALEEERDAVPAKMLGGGRPEIVQTVDTEKLAQVRAAKEAS